MARRALGPATLAVVQAVESALTPQDESLLVACSGGPDSLALAAGTQHVGQRRGLKAAAVVVDHRLQPDSAEVADRTDRQLRALGLDVVVSVVSVASGSGRGPEAAARAARYAALEAEAGRRGATVLLGHTLDDQAETVLLGMARGSGTRSLAGMAMRTGRYLRPLLGLRRPTTLAACTELGLDPWLDPHNRDDGYARVRVRSRVLPLLEAELGPRVAESLARTAALAREDADLLDDLAAAAHPATETLECAVLEQLAGPLRRRVIRRWLLASGAAEATHCHVVGVEELVLAWHGQRGIDLPGVRVIRVGGRLQCTACTSSSAVAG